MNDARTLHRQPVAPGTPGWANAIAALVVAAAAPAVAGGAVSFTDQVQPLLHDRCLACHGVDEQEGHLRLDTYDGIVRGGDSGEPLFRAGEGAASYLVERVTATDPVRRMPRKGRPLDEAEVDLLRRWIDEGALGPGGRPPAAARLTTDHWSFQPVSPVDPPLAGDPWVAGSVDGFILRGLREAGLEPSPAAGRVALIRRLYLGLHGLPPPPERVAAFLGDTRPRAYERLVDELLRSPRYGERWARHWLDVVRFAETNGFETNRERPTAYHFRDYVIAAFNADKPYDRFILEQIAGDAVGADVGTGFLVAGPYDIVKSPDINLTLMQRQDELADMINTTGTAFLGLTLGCARCHNHKFDPVLQKDYYSLQAVFAGVQHGERELPVPGNEAMREEVARLRSEVSALRMELGGLEAEARAAAARDEDGLRPAVNPRLNEERFPATAARFVRFTVHATNSSEPCIDELEVYDTAGKNVALASAGTVATASGTLPGYAIHQLEHINDGRHGNAHSWISNSPGSGWVQLEFPEPQRVGRILWGRDREERFRDRTATDYVIEIATEAGKWTPVASAADRAPLGGADLGKSLTAAIALLPPARAVRARELQRGVAELDRRISEGVAKATKAWIGTFVQPGPTHRLYRGEPTAKREEVAPDALTVLGSLGLKKDTPERERRLALARWIASPENPLTARVLVNRVWHYHFGTGIVATPSDFGANGVPPSHPELLDWLAADFVRSGWSIKHLHRQILLSNTYRQSGLPRADALAVDAGCRLLWRFPPRRLEAEAIRDSILAVSGALDLRAGGPGFEVFEVQLENVRHFFPKTEWGPEEWRRMVYMTKVRQEQDAVFGAFDCPDGNQVTPRRSRSTTPLQALNLFNSGFVVQQAELFADRLRDEAGGDASAQVERAFRLGFSRPPQPGERRDALALIRDHGLPAFTRALLNANEFLFVP